MSRGRTTRRGSGGFTIVEAIAVMVVLGVLGSLASALIYAAVTSYRSVAVLSQLHEEECTAMARLGVALRKIPLDPGAGVGTKAPMISTVTASSIAWGGNSSLTLSGSQLLLSENGGAAAPLLTNVVTFAVQCYDQSNAAMAASLSGAACYTIRRVGITVTVQREGLSDTLRCKFFIRSTMQGGAT